MFLPTVFNASVFFFFPTFYFLFDFEFSRVNPDLVDDKYQNQSHSDEEKSAD